MKSTNNPSNSKLKALKEIIQKEEYQDENIDNLEEEEDDEENEPKKEGQKDKILNNNNEELKSILKNNISQKNVNSNACTHNNDENRTENPEIKKHQRCVPLEIYTKVYNDKQTLLNQVELLNKEITTLNSSAINDELKLLDTKYKNLQREKTNIENILLNQ